MEKQHVLLMFLGGSPNSTNIVKHWETMNREFVNKENIFIVVHSKNVGDKISVNFKDIFKDENVFQVNEAHHVETAWATLSIVDALLLMMQYAHSQHSNKLFDKYILLSSTCCPLYRLDVIYDEICKDNKSIMGHKDRTGDFWMILDKRHAEFFFDKDAPQSTYEKEATGYECEQIAGRKTTHSHIKIIVEKTLDSKIERYFNLMKKNPCRVHDEYFIIECLNLMIEGNSTDHFRFINFKNFLENLRKIAETDEFKKIEDIKTKNEETNVYLHEIFDARLDAIYYISLGKLYILPKIILIEPTTKQMFIQSTYHHMFYSIEYNPTNVLRDFSFYKLDLSTFLTMNVDLSVLQTTIIEQLKPYIKKKEEKEEKEEEEEKEEKEKSIIFGDDKKYILAITSHPIEYDTFTLRSIINTFILLLELSYILLNDIYCDDFGKYQYIFYAYFCILVNKFELKTFQTLQGKEITVTELLTPPQDITCKEFLKKVNSIKDSFIKNLQTQISTLGIDETKKYGTFITGDILVEAICHGSFFIRKCFDTSLIETYSEVLSKLKYISEYEIKRNPPIKFSYKYRNGIDGLFDPSQYAFKSFKKSSRKSLKKSYRKKSSRKSSKKLSKKSSRKSSKKLSKKSSRKSFRKP